MCTVSSLEGFTRSLAVCNSSLRVQLVFQEADAEWEKAAALTKKAQELSREAQVLRGPRELVALHSVPLVLLDAICQWTPQCRHLKRSANSGPRRRSLL